MNILPLSQNGAPLTDAVIAELRASLGVASLADLEAVRTEGEVTATEVASAISDFTAEQALFSRDSLGAAQKPYAGAPANAVASTVTIDPTGANNSIKFTADVVGVAGDDLSVIVTVPANFPVIEIENVAGEFSINAGAANKLVISAVTVLDPDVAGTLLYAGLHNTYHSWTDDGSAVADGTYTIAVYAADVVGVKTWYLRNLAGTYIGVKASTAVVPAAVTGYFSASTGSGDATVAHLAPTAAEVIAAFNADAVTDDIITAEASGTVTGVIAAVTSTSLAGGVDGTPGALGRTAIDISDGKNDIWTAFEDNMTSTQAGWVKTYEKPS